MATNGSKAARANAHVKIGRRTTLALIRSQGPGSPDLPIGVSFFGQNTAAPNKRKRAGVSVNEAASTTARLKAMAGPAQRTFANSATPISPRPQITVAALAANAPPTP